MEQRTWQGMAHMQEQEWHGMLQLDKNQWSGMTVAKSKEWQGLSRSQRREMRGMNAYMLAKEKEEKEKASLGCFGRLFGAVPDRACFLSTVLCNLDLLLVLFALPIITNM